MRPTRAKAADIRDRRARLIQARIDGVPFQEIADNPDFGYDGNASAARKDFSRACRETMDAEKEAADTWRQLELDRLDHYLLSLAERVDRGEPRAIEVAIKVGERRARLLGIDAPVRAEVTVEEAPTAEDLELRDMINEAKARIALEERQLKGDR